MSSFQLPNKFLSIDVYKHLVNEQHFLVQLKNLFDWNGLAVPLEDIGSNDAGTGGKPRYPSVLMLKLLFVSFLFNLSDRDTEFHATNNILVKCFLELPITDTAPDHTTIHRFRELVLLKKGIAFFETTFRSLITEARNKGIQFSTVDALDATHTLAKVDTDKPQDPKTPRDPDASWGCKGDETRITSTGQKVKIPKYFHGYKAHLLAETGLGIITGFHATTGKTADIDGGDSLMHRTLNDTERSNIHVLLADKGYGCPVWINLLEKHTGIMTAFSLPEPMTKRGEHQEKWQTYKANEGRNAFKRDRYIIERVNADLKDHHGLRTCRYLGLLKYHFQVAMSSMAHNLKIFVHQLSGARFKPM